ncbi:MAG: hypothetical protein GF317_25080 [Candidatus Lokiarchaeota archaeon]|nr:hypothetical protein [Candidatus Lokiarchaeota archaeon]MBD3202633.1 hypothetical protein [Candidatus Lokiarchaeota archaeon]
MLQKENINDIEGLSKILSSIQNLYYRKKEQLDELEAEIEELKEVINNLNSLISTKSFHSADEIYSKRVMNEKTKKNPADDYFIEELPKDKVKGTKIKRKIFSKKDDSEELLCILNLFDVDKVKIKFMDAEKLEIQETSEDFIKLFLKQGLIKIKETNPELELNYHYHKNTDIIKEIDITHIKSVNEYDIITDQIRKLLSCEI